MKNNQRWRLPDGVEELLPAAAAQLEHLRRQLTDLHYCWGYELVMPPLIEYLDSLLTGSGELMDLQTFKLVDQLSGKMMGVRADMTPQVARIDAHLLGSDDVTRLFYMGSVLRTLPDAPGGSRSPLQLGAEIYGHAGVESDIEVILLMLKTAAVAGVVQPFLDLGHVGVYRGLVRHAGLNQEQESQLFDSLQRRSQPEIAEFLASLDIASGDRQMLSSLSSLNGPIAVLERAEDVLKSGGSAVSAALNSLRQITEDIHKRDLSADIHIDLAELRGYSYHTGVVFSVFSNDHSHEIARGGRYDDIGADFGRMRPATGYSADLKVLSRLVRPACADLDRRGVFVEDASVAGSWDEIDALRDQGERVVTKLPGSELDATKAGCDRQLSKHNGSWIVETV